MQVNRRLYFALPTEQNVLVLAIGIQFLVRATINGVCCMRAYTPTSLEVQDEVCECKCMGIICGGTGMWRHEYHPRLPVYQGRT
jgi:hypothetical protein